MSRVGRRPIDIPDGIKVEINGKNIKVEAKGKTLEHVMPHDFSAEVKDSKIFITRPSDSRAHRALHGTTRSLVQNMITGLKDGRVVEGKVRDDRGQERTFALRRYLPPSDCVIDLRISELGINIDTSNLSTREMVTITFEVENAGTLDVEHAPVEVFSVRDNFRPSGFPSYGSPYLYLIHEELVSVPVNGSTTVTFDVTSRNLYTRGIMAVVDPDNQMPEKPTEDNTATKDLPQDVVDINQVGLAKPAPDAGDQPSMNMGYMAIVVVVVIITLVIVGAVLYLRRQD